MPEEENNQEQESPEAEAAPAEAPAEEAPAPEAEEAPAPEETAAPDEPAPPEEPAAEAEPQEALGPKERRKRGRSTHTGEPAPQRSVEERLAERAEARRKKAEERRRWRTRSRERRKAAPHDTTPQAPVEHEHARPRVRQGVVVSNKADKTITVRIEVQRAHRTYGKVVRNTSTLHAHDERNEAHAGDTVRVVESRPLSRSKRWRLVEILERAR
jgi:small subunit ribosomal protein S17